MSDGIGFGFHILGNPSDERFGRREKLIATVLAPAPFTVPFHFAVPPAMTAIVRFGLCRATSGTRSGAGYADQGESFPARIRGTAVGFLSAFGNPAATWFTVATLFSFGTRITLRLRRIPPRLEPEQIAA